MNKLTPLSYYLTMTSKKSKREPEPEPEKLVAIEVVDLFKNSFDQFVIPSLEEIAFDNLFIMLCALRMPNVLFVILNFTHLDGLKANGK